MAQRAFIQFLLFMVAQLPLLLVPQVVRAGGWSPTLDAAGMVDRADLIVVGTVIKAGAALSNSPFSDELWEADLSVARILKGKLAAQSLHIIFSPGNYKADLRYPLAKGDTGVFFIKEDNVRGFQLLTYGSVAKFDRQFVCETPSSEGHNPSRDVAATE